MNATTNPEIENSSTARAELRRAHWWMLAIVAVAGVLMVAFGERFPLGFAWDTDWYVDEAANLHQRLVVEGLNDYRLQRVLPSAVVWLGLRLLYAPADPRTAETGFAILDLLLVLGACWLWRGVADDLRLGLRARWLGFLGLFVNFALLKHAYYMPALTDVAAFAAGMLALRLYLARRNIALALLAVTGGFVFPTIAPSAALLLLWPAGSVAPPSDRRRHLASLLAGGVALGTAAAFVMLHYLRGRTQVGFGAVVPVIAALAPVSVAITSLHLFFGLRPVADGADVPYVMRALRALRPANVLLALGALAVPRAIARALQSSETVIMTTRTFAGYLVMLPNTRPYVLLVAHAVWFGPVVLLLWLAWPRVCEVARALGPGMLLLLAFSLLIALTPESRQSSFAYPVLVALVAAALDRDGAVSPPLLAVTAAASLLFSRAWTTLNTPQMLATPRTPIADVEQARVAFRRYFVESGPWMPNDAYGWQAMLVLLLGVLLFALLRRERPTGQRDAEVADGPVRASTA